MFLVFRHRDVWLDNPVRSRHKPRSGMGPESADLAPGAAGEAMRRIVPSVILSALTLGSAGCLSRPLLDNPAFVRPDPALTCPNPTQVALGPTAYAVVFEAVLDALDDYFEIAFANRYDGTIRTHPKIAPGLEQPWKPGSPNAQERLLATLQTIRYRGDVTIQPGSQTGYLVSVVVFKEVEDLYRPIRATAGSAAFRSDNSVDRQFEVVDPSVLDQNWVPLGRECHLEQMILQRINQKVRERSKCCEP